MLLINKYNTYKHDTQARVPRRQVLCLTSETQARVPLGLFYPFRAQFEFSVL